MKKLLVLLIGLSFGLSVKGQQVPLYSNYFFTPYVYNPATSGASGVTELAVMYRKQWADIQGSPETFGFGLNGAVNDEKVGWSLYGFGDQTDILKRVGIYGNYAYMLRLTDNSTLSFGLGAGFINQTIDQEGVRAADAGDLYTFATPNRGVFDINAGINFKIADFQLGFSAPQVLSQNINYTTDQDTGGVLAFDMIRHYTATARYDFKFDGDKQILTPLVMIRAGETVPFQVDAGVLYNMVEYGYVGAMFRSDYAVTANLGINFTEALTFGYAYDFSLNQYASSLGTSHELMLTYRFGSNKNNERLENEIKRIKQKQRRQNEEVEDIVDEKLEEFKDSYRNDIESEMDEQRKKLEEDLEKQRAELERNQRNNTSSNNQQSQNNNQQNYSDNQNTSNYNQGSTQNGGYDASNQAMNVEPGSRGYYVTAGVFSSKGNAERLVSKLSSQGFGARFFQDTKNNFFYVYLLKFDSYQQANQAKDSRMNGSYSGDLWVKIVE